VNPTPAWIVEVLANVGLLGDGTLVDARRLDGGVSSDVWYARTTSAEVCIKRALARLRVDQLWTAPVSRTANEFYWYDVVRGIAPASIPSLVRRDLSSGALVMSYLTPARHANWKMQLLSGRIAPLVAAGLGATLARIHAATAGDVSISTQLGDLSLFAQLRIDPYLRSLLPAHADLELQLSKIIDHLAITRIAMIHGDVSPKNVLVADANPVLLDAEVACFGDPAFDAAFMTTHLLLKAVHDPQRRREFTDCWSAFIAAFLAGSAWEDSDLLERRIAWIVPALLLARIDGKSPVEYLKEGERNQVRSSAREMLRAMPESVAQIAEALYGTVVP